MGDIYDPFQPNNWGQTVGGYGGGAFQPPSGWITISKAGVVVGYLDPRTGIQYDSLGYPLGPGDPNNPNGTGTGSSSSGGGGGGSSGSGTVFTTGDGQKLSQAEYDALSANLIHIGKMYGYTFDTGKINAALKLGLTPDEVQTRLEAAQWATQNANNRAGFEYSLKQHGEGGHINDEDWRKFSLGLGPKKWMDVWQTAAAAGGILSAGATLGETDQGGVEFTKGNVRHLEGLLPDAQSAGFGLAAQDQQSIAQVVAIGLKALPAGRFGGFSYGTNINQLADAVLAGDQQALTKAQQIIANEAAKAKGPIVGAQLVGSQSGRVTLSGLAGQGGGQGP